MRVLVMLATLLIGATSASADTAWEQYLAHPTSQNARKVAKMEYSTGRVPEGGYDAVDLQILEDQVLAGDSAAFQLAFRLYRQADGGLAEDLGIIIGRSVRVNPTFFLRQVSASGKPCADFAWMLRAPGPEYVDRPLAQQYEIRERRTALESVAEPELARVRDTCIAALARPRKR